MQDQAWIEMLRRIPVSYHEGLILSTATGVDIVLQHVIRIEDEFLILRGRPAGTNDSGKIIVVPLVQINFLTLPGKLKEQQVKEIFGEPDYSYSAALPEGNEDARENPEPVEGTTSGANNGTASSPSQPEPAAPTKAMLLAKLRAKFAGENSMSARGK